jgi:hypothetical protein
MEKLLSRGLTQMNADFLIRVYPCPSVAKKGSIQ